MTTPRQQQIATTTLQTRLLNLAAESAGFSASEITGFSPQTVRSAAAALVKTGALVSARVSPRRVRYFANQTLARAYKAKPSRSSVTTLSAGPRFKAAWRADEPAIITPRTKITIAPPLPRDVFRTATYPQF